MSYCLVILKSISGPDDFFGKRTVITNGLLMLEEEQGKMFVQSYKVGLHLAIPAKKNVGRRQGRDLTTLRRPSKQLHYSRNASGTIC